MRISESFKQYTKELSADKYNPLNALDERKYLQEFSSGSVQAFNKLVNAHLRFVIYSLRNYAILDPTIDIMDLVQEGNLGLIEGLRRYDTSNYTCRAFSFCFYYIRFYINRFLSKYRKFSINWSEIPDDQSLEDLPNELKEDGWTVYDFDYEEILNDIIVNALNDLTEKEKVVLVLFFGIKHPYMPKTLREIGSILNMSFESIRKLKDSALEKIDKKYIQQLM